MVSLEPGLIEFHCFLSYLQSAHAAFDKAASYFGMKIIRVPEQNDEVDAWVSSSEGLLSVWGWVKRKVHLITQLFQGHTWIDWECLDYSIRTWKNLPLAVVSPCSISPSDIRNVHRKLRLTWYLKDLSSASAPSLSSLFVK